MKALRQPLAGPVFSALAAWMFVFSAIAGEQVNSISLAGTWRFRLDPNNVGVDKKWFTEKLEDSVTLPGTTDTNQKGEFKDERAVDRLSRVWYWKGPAWYQREVVIPDSWKGKRITLLLERTKNTRVWVDDKDCGADDTLSAPQVFDLTARPHARPAYDYRAGGQRQAAAGRPVPRGGRAHAVQLERHRRQNGTARHRSGLD